MNNAKKHQSNMKNMSISWENGSENVFTDLGMPDAGEKLVKARLAFKLNEIIEERGLKQAEAAKLLGLDQAKISLLHCGHLKDFSVERLVHLLTLLNQDIDIVVRRTRQVSGRGTLRVMYA